MCFHDGRGVDPGGRLDARDGVREERRIREHFEAHGVEAGAEGPGGHRVTTEARLDSFLEHEANGGGEGVGRGG
jgi:hypothetical protein